MTIQAVQVQTPVKNINTLLAGMGLKVDKAVEQAITALLYSETHKSAGLMENVVAIQELEVALDEAILAALENGDLPTSDLQQATSVVNINKALARLGKLAANLGRKVTQVGEHRKQEDFSRLQPLAIAVSHLCHLTLQSLRRLDPVLLRNAASGHALVDAYRDYVFRGLHTSDEQHTHLIFASRCLEQIADSALDLAENLVTFLASPMGSRAAGEQLAC